MKIICLSKFVSGFLHQLSSDFTRALHLPTAVHWLWEEGNLAQFLLPSESKNAHFSFGRNDDLLGHLDGRPTLVGEALETLESVVYEKPVLVRLASVVI